MARGGRRRRRQPRGVARLAGTSSPTLDTIAEKVEALVARLSPEDGDGVGLCAAEVRLLQSVLRDLRAFAADLVFAVQGAGHAGSSAE
jgi:hypothetical protein